MVLFMKTVELVLTAIAMASDGLGQSDARIEGVVHLVAEIADGTVNIDVWFGLGAHVGS